MYYKTRTKFSVALSLAVIFSLLLSSFALADNVQNDVVAGGNDTITTGGSTTINYRINSNNGDGQTGCNAADTTPATVLVNVPAGVTATPSSLQFTSCDTNKAVVFSSTVVGSYDITVSVSDGGSGSYNTSPAKFTLHVNAPPLPSDTTAPVVTPNVSGTLGNNGWYTSDVTVSWSVVDNESNITSSNGCETTEITADTAGTTLTCSATSTGGTASESVTIKRDATAPAASASASPAANANGWNNTDVTVSFTGNDALSGVASCTAAAVLSDEGANQSASGTCTDNAGNVSAAATVSGINIDKTAPTASATASPAANANGWNNTDVTVSFTGSDSLSGIDFCSADAVLSAEGANQSASGTCTDKAGNVSASAIASSINIDKTAPTVSLVGGPANGASYYFGFVPAGPTCSASDALSGLDGSCSVTGYSAAVGSHTVTASATDNAGNSASASSSYTVLAWTLKGFYQPVDMNGVYNTVKNGSTVPFKFELFAGSTELTDVAYVTSFKYVDTNCSATATTDDIETVATGNTVLRYDSVAGQYVYNWKTPATAGKCYRVTMTAQDGSTLQAYFKLK